MNRTEVTTDGLKGARPDREATTGVNTGPGTPDLPTTARRRRGGERPVVPDAEFRSYYGQAIINRPVWESRDIAGYLFLGGLAGASSLYAAVSQLTGRRRSARVAKVTASGAAALSLAALVHDLGRRGRFLNMLRTFKPTSPMSVGSWLLAAYGPATTLAAASEVTQLLPVVGGLATAGAAFLGPGVATYTAALVCNTAVPAWHDGYRQMPFVFAASAASSAAGVVLAASPVAEAGPARLLGAVSGAAELATGEWMRKEMGLAAEAFDEGKASRYHRLSRPLLAAGVLGAVAGRRSRLAAAAGGAALFAGSALTRLAIFHAGLVSAADPRYTVVPQRERLARVGGETTRAGERGPGPGER